jgi:23S rRNA pseudouridine1911/1915/1917 synthase
MRNAIQMPNFMRHTIKTVINSYSHMVPPQITPRRLQEYGVGLFEAIPTKSALKKALKKQQVEVNGSIASTATIIKGGETIVFSGAEIEPSHKKIDLKLKVVFEDDHLAAIHKPAGILVSGNSFKTIANALPQNLLKSEQPDAVRPQPVHRLDYATTGILLVGKTASGIRSLNQLFELKKVEKTYYAVTIGDMESSGTIKTLIKGKEAISHYKKVDIVPSTRFKQLNLVKLKPETGRRHQLRIHLAGIGNPILGDRDYSPESLLLKGKGMYLHAFSVQFVHPATGKIVTPKALLPERFTKIFGP